jgi:transposase-like protein
MIVTDGGRGLPAALPLVYPRLPVQRCWVHKLRNVLDKTRKKDRLRVKRDLDRVMNAPTLPQARTAGSANPPMNSASRVRRSGLPRRGAAGASGKPAVGTWKGKF